MIKLTEPSKEFGSIYIGDSHDEEYRNLKELNIGAILNVARDMTTVHNYSTGHELIHIGLIDGPGNEAWKYYAAVISLYSLIRHHNTLVCCHSGSRSVVVALMYLSLREGCVKERVDFLRRRSWDEMFEMVQSRAGEYLPKPHQAHIDAFNKMKFGVLEALL